jgi:uncharacterized protein YlaI
MKTKYKCFYCENIDIFPMKELTTSLIRKVLLPKTNRLNQDRLIAYAIANFDICEHICYDCIHDISSMNEERINEMLFKLKLGLI